MESRIASLHFILSRDSKSFGIGLLNEQAPDYSLIATIIYL